MRYVIGVSWMHMCVTLIINKSTHLRGTCIWFTHCMKDGVHFSMKARRKRSHGMRACMSIAESKGCGEQEVVLSSTQNLMVGFKPPICTY